MIIISSKLNKIRFVILLLTQKKRISKQGKKVYFVSLIVIFCLILKGCFLKKKQKVF